MNNNGGFLMKVFDHIGNLCSLFFLDMKFRDRMDSSILTQLSTHTVVMKHSAKNALGENLREGDGFVQNNIYILATRDLAIS